MPQVTLPSGAQGVLSFVAGYVDSATFVGLSGLFVAQVTGSFVLAGAAVVSHDPGLVAKVLAIPTFLLAAVATTLIVSAAETARAAMVRGLAVEVALLCALALAGTLAHPVSDLDSPAALTATMCGLAAMGVQSALVRVLSSSGSTNVMTTNTTQLGIDAAQLLQALLRLRRSGNSAVAADYVAACARCARVVPLIIGFAVGTAVGALAFWMVGFASLVLPLLILVGTAAWASRLG